VSPVKSEGENAANWIIGKITEYAKATKEPFSGREVHFLRLSIMDFDLKDREEFLAVNSKTVRVIRDTITDEKLAGAECVEARQGLYIPTDWRDNYLKVYDSELPWLVSHCAQSAMLSEPTLGESTWWQSPRVTHGFRPSVVGRVETNSMDTESSDEEFDLLISSFQGFISVGGMLKIYLNIIATSVGRPLFETDITAVSRVEALSIAFALSDCDDDVTASIAHWIFDEEILSTEVNQRESLYSKTIPGVGLIFSKSKIMDWEVCQNFSLDKPTTVLNSAFLLDRFCHGLGIRPIGVKLYAIKAAQLAGVVARSSVFSSRPLENLPPAFSYGSFLKACIEISEFPGLNSKSDDQILSEIQNSMKANSKMRDLIDVMELSEDFFSSLSDWQIELRELCIEVARCRLELNDEEDQEYSDIGESAEIETNSESRSTSVRLKELNELLHDEEITLEEYSAKRNQIINEI